MLLYNFFSEPNQERGMKVKINRAVNMFFGKSSLEMVFFEAIANALDANATEIKINIYLETLSQLSTLRIEISDNGEGFTDERYKKFSNLFDVNESTHKGLGRLVYLCYFDRVDVCSIYDRTKKRKFTFSDDFDEQNFTVETIAERSSGTVFTMTGYSLQKIAKNEYIQPQKMKHRILEEFYARLFELKKNGSQFKIKIELTLEGHESESEIVSDDIPDFEVIELDSKINLIDSLSLYYSIEKVENEEESSLIAAISVDNRTVKIDLIADECKLMTYKMVFLLYSDYFLGKIDATRENLTLSSQELKEVQTLFRKQVIAIIEDKIPAIKERNIATKNSLVDAYPHLGSYFDTKNIGYISRNDILKKAQDDFFKEQKEILDATSLSEEQFEKSIELSSRALTEYVLFRQLTIEKLKKMDSSNSETEIHKLIASMGKEGRFEKKDSVDDLYRNNAWLLDDKYMTYETVLSNREMGELIQLISDEQDRDGNKPDIAIVFSNDPAHEKPFDIVIVELKKKGISLEENMKVVTQLEKRARKLMHYYNNQIQRIWFYGIIEFNEEVEMQLAGDYIELYSSGKMYYRETNVVISLNPRKALPIGVFICDMNAMISDADSRNSAFLNLIKSKFIQP